MQGNHTSAGGEIPLRTHPMAQGGVRPHHMRAHETFPNAVAPWAAVVMVALGIPALIVIAAVTALTGHFADFQRLMRRTDENLAVGDSCKWFMLF